MADIKNYGLAGIGANVQLGKNGGYIDYTGDAFSLTTFGGGDAVLNLGNVTVSNTFSDGTLTIASGNLDTTGDLTANVVNFGSLDDGTITITNFDNDGTLAANSATVVATQQAVKSYIDNNVTAQDLDFQGDTGGALAIDLDSETLTIAGGTNINTSGADNTLTVNLDDDVSLAGNLSAVDGTFSGTVDITGNLVVGGVLVSGSEGSPGEITGLENLTATNITAESNLTVNGTLVNGINDDDTMSNASNTTLATSESIKAYVDDQVSTSSADANLNVAGDTGTGVINLSTETLTVNGTANEIETAFDGTQTFTIGLPDDVTIGNDLTVTNDATVSGSLTVTGDAVVTGNLTINGNTTIVNTETVNIEDNIIRVNTSGTGPSAGLEANIGGTIESMVYDPNASLSPDSNDDGAWVFSDDVIATTTLSAGNLQTTGTATVGTLTDGTATLTGGELTGAGNITAAGTVTGGTLTDGTLTISGGAITGATGNIVTTGTVQGGTVTDGTATLTGGDLTTTGNVDAGIVEGDTVTDGTATLTGGNFSGLGTVTATSFTDGTATLTTGNLTTTGTVDAGTVEFDSLSGTGAVAVTDIIDDDTMATASNTTLATSKSIKDYVDAQATAASLEFTDDAGTAGLSIDLDTEVLTIAGGTNITTAGSGNTLTVNLDASITLTDGTFTGTVDAANVEFDSLSGTGAVSVTNILDEDDMSSDSATALATQQSIKAYVDTQVSTSSAGANLNVAGDSGTGVINLSTETMTVNGTANEIETVFDGTQTFTIGLPDDVTIGQDLTVTRDLSVSRNVEISGNLTVTGSTTTIDVTELSITDSLIHLAANNEVSDTLDIGFIGHYSDDGGVTSEHTGFVRDATDGKYRLFELLVQAGLDNGTDTTVDFANATIATAVANIEGDISGAEATFTGNVSFGTLVDSGESISISKFVDEADGIANNDNDTSIPTTAAVIDYVTTNSAAAPDGLLLRNSFTANSTDSTFNVGTVPNISGRSYYADRVVVNVGTLFDGGSVDHIVITENGTGGSVLVAEADADALVAGTYVVQLDGTTALTANQPVTVSFFQTDGTTPAVVTAGQVTVAVHYNWV